MREIKVRVWDVDPKQMIYWPNQKYDLYLTNDGWKLAIFHRGVKLPDFTRPIIVLECTGLKDKNGVEIYEGDIVKGVLGKKGTVKFGEHCDQDYYAQPSTGWYYDVPGVDVRSISPSRYGFEDIEVIGNIYENPEVLNKGE